MNKSILTLVAITAISFSSLSLNAQEKGGKKDPAAVMVTQLIKQLEKAELTPDQTTKIKEIYTKVATEVSKKRTEGGITAEMLTKRTEAFKSMKDSGKKGKEQQDAVTAAMGLNADQKKLFEETEAVLNKARVEIGKLLTPEQLAKLPENSQRQMKEKTKGKKSELFQASLPF